MKNLIYIIILFSIFQFGCGNEKHKRYYTNEENNVYIRDTISIEGCQYFTIFSYGGNCVILHKGNCNNPIHYEYENIKKLNTVDSQKIEYQKYLLLKQKFDKSIE